MRVNTWKFYFKADRTLLKFGTQEAAFLGSTEQAVILVTPFTGYNKRVAVTFPDGKVDYAQSLVDTGLTESVEVSIGVFEEWHIYEGEIRGETMTYMANVNVQKALLTFLDEVVNYDTETSLVYKGLYQVLPDVLLFTNDNYIGLGVLQVRRDNSCYKLVSGAWIPQSQTVGDFEDTNSLTVQVAYLPSETVDGSISPGSKNFITENVNIEETGVINFRVTTNEVDIANIFNLLGLTGEKKVSTAMGATYLETISLESNDKFYVEKLNGDERFATFQTISEQVQGIPIGTFDTATGTGCPDPKDLICAHPNGIADPTTRQNQIANVLSTGTVWKWNVALNLWVDSGLASTEADQITVNNAGNTLTGVNVQEDIDQSDAKVETNRTNRIADRTDIDSNDVEILTLQNDKYDKTGGTITGDVTIQGTLITQGAITEQDSINSTVKDNTIVLNNGEAGAGVTAGRSGHIVDRGSLTNYATEFVEASGKLEMGLVGDTKPVATEEYVNARKFIDSPDTPASYPAGTEGYDTVVNETLDGVLFTRPNNNTSTGVITGLQLSVASATEINVASGSFLVVTYADPTNPRTTQVNFAGATNVTVPTIATGFATYVSIDETGTLQFSNADLSPQQRRSLVGLGVVAHLDQINIFNTHSQPVVNAQPINQTLDRHKRIEYRDGVKYTGNTNQSFQKSAGTLVGTGINYDTNPLSADVRNIPAETPVPHFIIYRDGLGGVNFTPSTATAHLFDNTLYDDGSGTLATLDNSTKYTNNYIYITGLGTTFIVYGQTQYSTLQDAIDARTNGTDIIQGVPQGLLDLVVLRNIWTAWKDSTNFQDANNVFFEPAGGGNVGGTVANVDDTNVNMTVALPNFGNALTLSTFAVNLDANSELKSNKTDDIEGNKTSSIKFTTAKGVVDYVDQVYQANLQLPIITNDNSLLPSGITNTQLNPSQVNVDSFGFKVDQLLDNTDDFVNWVNEIIEDGFLKLVRDTNNNVEQPFNWTPNAQYTVLANIVENDSGSGTQLLRSTETGSVDINPGASFTGIYKEAFTSGATPGTKVLSNITTPSGAIFKFKMVLLEGDFSTIDDDTALSILNIDFGEAITRLNQIVEGKNYHPMSIDLLGNFVASQALGVIYNEANILPSTTYVTVAINGDTVMPVLPSTTYRWTASNRDQDYLMVWVELDKNKVVIERNVVGITNAGNIVTNSDVHFIALSFRRVANTDMTPQDFIDSGTEIQIEEGSVSTTFEQYHKDEKEMPFSDLMVDPDNPISFQTTMSIVNGGRGYFEVPTNGNFINALNKGFKQYLEAMPALAGVIEATGIIQGQMGKLETDYKNIDRVPKPINDLNNVPALTTENVNMTAGVVTIEGIEVTNLVANGNVGATFVADANGTRFTLDANGDTNSMSGTTYESGAQNFPLTASNKYYLKASSDVIDSLQDLGFVYSDNTDEFVNLAVGNSQSAVITASKTLNANPFFSEGSEIGITTIKFHVVEILPTDSLFNKSDSEINIVLGTHFDNTTNTKIVVINEGVNIFDINNLEQGALSLSNGSKSASTVTLRLIDNILIRKLEELTIKINNISIGAKTLRFDNYYFYDNNGSFISAVDTVSVNEITFVPPANATQFNTQILYTDVSTILPSEIVNADIQLQRGDTPTTFVPYAGVSEFQEVQADGFETANINYPKDGRTTYRIPDGFVGSPNLNWSEGQSQGEMNNGFAKGILDNQADITDNKNAIAQNKIDVLNADKWVKIQEEVRDTTTESNYIINLTTPLKLDEHFQIELQGGRTNLAIDEASLIRIGFNSDTGNNYTSLYEVYSTRDLTKDVNDDIDGTTIALGMSTNTVSSKIDITNYNDTILVTHRSTAYNQVTGTPTTLQGLQVITGTGVWLNPIASSDITQITIHSAPADFIIKVYKLQ